MRISDWSSDVCSSDLGTAVRRVENGEGEGAGQVIEKPLPVLAIGEPQGRGSALRLLRLGQRRQAPARRADDDGPGFLRVRKRGGGTGRAHPGSLRSEEHTSELQSLMRTSYAVFRLKKKRKT